MKERNRKKRRNMQVYVMAIIPFLLLVVLFLFAPMGSMIYNSFKSAETGGFTFDNYYLLFTKQYYLSSIVNSLEVSLVSTFAGLFIAFLTAYAVNNLFPRAKRVLMSILNMTSNFAGVTLAFSFIILLGRTGMIVNAARELNIDSIANFNFYSLSGLMITYIYFQIPLGTLLLIPPMAGLKQEWRESAEILKATPFKFWTQIGIPMLTPSILGTLSILFANAIAAYGTAYAIFIINFPLMTIRIAAMFTGDIVQQVELGSAMSMLLAVFMCISILISTKVMSKSRWVAS